ncbi:MAG: helix-turn-helix domain-containing protein [Stenotrophomonas sp.]
MSAQRKTPAPAAIIAPSLYPDTMGLEQAAEYLRLGRDSTHALFDAGVLPGVSLNQKHLVFRRTALDAFLAATELQQQKERARKAITTHSANDPSPPKRTRRRELPDLGKYESK